MALLQWSHWDILQCSHLSHAIQFYNSGVYYSTSYNSERQNHEALVAGYGTSSDSSKYWLIKSRYKYRHTSLFLAMGKTGAILAMFGWQGTFIWLHLSFI